MDEIEQLLEGYRSFHKQYFVEDDSLYQKLKEGQSPKVAMIACSDSRVDLSIITSAKPGELFVIRNVANLVPPYQPDDATYHGTSAALEFAINNLSIEHIIVFGHSKCAGIRALVDDRLTAGGNLSFVRSWMNIAKEAKKEVVAEGKNLSIDHQAHLCERKAIEKSLENLATFPWVAERMNAETMQLHGWHFDIDTGTIFSFDKESGSWAEKS